MKKDSALVQVLRGDHDGAVKAMFPFPLSGPRSMLSANLTAAMNLLLLDLSMDMWEGLVRSLCLPVWMAKLAISGWVHRG